MSSPPPPSAQDLLMPGGTPIGKKGKRSSIREVPGGKDEAEDLFDDLMANRRLLHLPSYRERCWPPAAPGGQPAGFVRRQRAVSQRLMWIYPAFRSRRSSSCKEERWPILKQ